MKRICYLNNLLSWRLPLFIATLFTVLALSAQQSCYEQYLRAHNMPLPTDSMTVDDSYDELKKEVIARQLIREESRLATQPIHQPIFLAIDTLAGTCHLLAEDGTILADVHLAMVDSTWYMWLSVDPLADKYIANTPYMYCNGNPIMFIDPDGRGTFFVGRFAIGNDGIDDNKTYYIKTRKTLITDKNLSTEEYSVAAAGFQGEARKNAIRFIKKNSGNAEAFSNNPDIYDGFVELVSKELRLQMWQDLSSKDNGHGGECESNNREYGGTIRNGVLADKIIGDLNSPLCNAEIHLPSNVSTYHSHPSGECKVSNTWHYFVQTPSSLDIQNAGNFNHYQFGMKEKIVSMYNANGVLFVMPLRRFLKIGF